MGEKQSGSNVHGNDFEREEQTIDRDVLNDSRGRDTGLS